ncbi:hypothetical protein SAMN04489712_11148 [Thermomonospora echinospora]|uniref:Uncharacterized protein n=1 Tax=Thermomonospora echinospora TaxID=1992 RepID=A0A1H6CR72_9ACTN|nr:hypothetical protein [Thermomonospora echinospora]SEG75512.1 hypothetical protein SAMN04489712_11148 [Thermomonospora echinospora]
MSDPYEVETHAVRVLSALFLQLVRASWPAVKVAFRDAIPRLEVTGPSGVVIDVRMDEDGAQFVFRPSFRRHSIEDVPGAVEAVLTLVRDCGGSLSSDARSAGGGAGE